MRSALPDNWIDALFARLTGLYGNRFTNMWAAIDAKLVRQTWAQELAGVTPSAIKYALENLPDEFPPTALQFKKICFMRPEQVPALTNSAPAHPDVRKAVLLGLSAHTVGGPRDWAHRLKARDDAGDRLNGNQVRCYKNALGLHEGGRQA